MNTSLALGEFRREQRFVATAGERLEQLPHVTRRWTLGVNECLITAFALDREIADDKIGSQIRELQNCGAEFEWKAYSYDLPADLLHRLAAAGLSIGEREALVVYDLEDGFQPFERPPSCDVRRVEDEDQLIDFRKAAEAIFEKDYSFTTRQLAEAIRTGTKGHDAYVGYCDEVPVAVGRLYTDAHSQFAGFYGGGTMKEHRGKGHYRAITAARACDARSHGARYLQVDALPTSLPILLRLGFTHLADTWPCTGTPNAAA